MEQSRIASQQPSQGTHVAARVKGATRPVNDPAQDAALPGGFMALMAALGEDLPADDAAVLPGVDGLIDAPSAAAGSLYDPTSLSHAQGLLAGALCATGAAAGGLPGAACQGSMDGSVGSARVTWVQDRPGDGLVAQTAALDGLGDVKDGDVAAGVLAQGRPAISRATTSFAQRSEVLNALAGGLMGKSSVPELGKATHVAAEASVALSGGLASSLPARELGVTPGGREGAVGGESLGLAGADIATAGAASQGVGSAEIWQRVASEVEEGHHGGGDASLGGYALEQVAARADDSASASASMSADGVVQPGVEDALAEQVTYWVNQKSQNAEMTLTRDGQPVGVSVSLSGNEAHVTFRSDQEQTRQMLDGGMAQLSDMLREQGLILSGVSVGTSAREGQPRGGDAEQQSGGRMGQAQVVAAQASADGKPSGVDGRHTLDVFV